MCLQRVRLEGSFPSLNGCLIRAAYPLSRLTQKQRCYTQRRAPGFCQQPKHGIPIEIIRCSAPTSTACVTGSHMGFGTCQDKHSYKGLTKFKSVRKSRVSSPGIFAPPPNTCFANSPSCPWWEPWPPRPCPLPLLSWWLQH